MKRNNTRAKHSFGDTTRNVMARMTGLPTITPSKRDGWIQ